MQTSKLRPYPYTCKKKKWNRFVLNWFKLRAVPELNVLGGGGGGTFYLDPPYINFENLYSPTCRK